MQTTAEIERHRAEQQEFLSVGHVHVRELNAEITPQDNRSVELSFSSETPVERYDWYEAHPYNEILGHSPGNVDLTRLSSIGVMLWNHDQDSPIARIDSVSLDEKNKKCRAVVVFDCDEDSETLYQKVLSGTLKGVSVGYKVRRWEKVDEGVTTTDGFAGPAMIARDWEPLEISLVSVPADISVGVGRNIDLGRSGSNMEQILAKIRAAAERIRSANGTVESFRTEAATICDDITVTVNHENVAAARAVVDEEAEKFTRVAAAAPAPAPAANPVEAARAEVAAERRRVSEITALCRSFNMDPQSYIDNGSALDAVRAAVLDEVRRNGAPVPTNGSAEITAEETDKFRSAAIDGLRLRCGHRVVKPAAGAESFRGATIDALAREILERGGQRASYREGRMDVAKRAFSTSDFPYILGGLARATLMDSYTAAPATWQAWCATGSLSDFKEQTIVKLSSTGDLELVPEGDEYKFSHFSESKDSIRLYTYGEKFALTRQAIINDDLRAFTRLPQKFGNATARTINKAVYAIINSNTVKMAEDNKVLFHADHGNLGTAGAISTTTLSEARAAMRRQKDPTKNETLNIYPSYLIVPPEQETKAEQVLGSQADINAAQSGVLNPFRDKFSIISDANLTDTSAWYLASSAQLVDTVEVAFLDGVNAPVIEQQPGWDVDGIEWKIRIDFGVKCWDYRGLYKNAGI